MKTTNQNILSYITSDIGRKHCTFYKSVNQSINLPVLWQDVGVYQKSCSSGISYCRRAHIVQPSVTFLPNLLHQLSTKWHCFSLHTLQNCPLLDLLKNISKKPLNNRLTVGHFNQQSIAARLGLFKQNFSILHWTPKSVIHSPFGSLN